MNNLGLDFCAQTVIVTGAARGIGRELGGHFRASRAAVYLVDHDGDEVEKAAAARGARSLCCDVSETEDVEAAVARIIAETGRPDVVVNDAGLLRDKLLWKMTGEDRDQVLKVYVGGEAAYVTGAVLPVDGGISM